MTRRDWMRRMACGAAVVGLVRRQLGPVYDCRKYPVTGAITPLSSGWQSFRCFDARTGEEVQRVFFYDTNTHRLGRYLLNEHGCCFVGENDEVAGVWETRPLRLVQA